MTLVTIGLDFGTSSIKCIARPYGSPNGSAKVIASEAGRYRWPTLLGQFTAGPNSGKLLLFENCLEPERRYDSLIEHNLKLVLLLEPDSAAYIALTRRWRHSAYALPVVVLAAAIRHATRSVREHWTGAAINIICGAPIGPKDPPQQLERFERALHAALKLSEVWRDEVPTNAKDAVYAAEVEWQLAKKIPTPEGRVTRVVPEGYAALKGVASVGGRTDLPEGGICLIDMGGGTTDVIWARHNGEGNLTPLGAQSVDFAGERVDALLANLASDQCKRQVQREEIWDSRKEWTLNDGLARTDWALPDAAMRDLLEPQISEAVQRIKAVFAEVLLNNANKLPMHLLFVGGATRWQMLADLVTRQVKLLHPRLDPPVQLISVAYYGLDRDFGEIPIAVALGLSLGMARLDGWLETPCAPDLEVRSAPNPISFCPCGGALYNCRRCGGSGVLESEAGAPRFSTRIDPFVPPADVVRCLECGGLFPIDSYFRHLQQAHATQAPAPIDPAPPLQPAQRLYLALRVAPLRSALQGVNVDRLTAAESILYGDINWYRHGCAEAGEQLAERSQRFLERTLLWVKGNQWIELPRAIAFKNLGSQCEQDVQESLRHAETTNPSVALELKEILGTGDSHWSVKAWECILR